MNTYCMLNTLVGGGDALVNMLTLPNFMMTSLPDSRWKLSLHNQCPSCI